MVQRKCTNSMEFSKNFKVQWLIIYPIKNNNNHKVSLLWSLLRGKLCVHVQVLYQNPEETSLIRIIFNTNLQKVFGAHQHPLEFSDCSYYRFINSNSLFKGQNKGKEFLRNVNHIHIIIFLQKFQNSLLKVHIPCFF